ncbi:MAG: WbqC family protein [Robiginitomaculum sp.]|nr:WbqC family protein [Robiginitomaculum sp.]MDQ7077608.1 WbqC family protein [Robiginitomaculum sp.]
MTSLAIMQPVYLPWLGYFEQMALCDHFIFLDDVQYTKQDWRNRNRIRTKKDWCWLTIPVRKGGLDTRLCDVRISDHKNWARAHLLSIRQNYARAPYFEEVFPLVENRLQSPPDRLTDLTIGLIADFAKHLQITTPTQRASDIAGNTNDPVARIIELCHHVGADVYYTGPSAASYLDTEALKNAGIAAIFQDYQHPVYSQVYPGFESHMAVVDLLMTQGPAARSTLLSSPIPAALRP